MFIGNRRSVLCFTQNPILALIGIMLCEFAYGGNFSVLPSLLSKYFGQSAVSTIHAMTLSGWGLAGLIGPALANIFTDNNLYLVLGLLYLIGFIGFTVCVKKQE